MQCETFRLCIFSTMCAKSICISAGHRKCVQLGRLLKCRFVRINVGFNPFILRILNFIKGLYYVQYLRVTCRIFSSITFTICAKIPLSDNFDKLDGWKIYNAIPYCESGSSHNFGVLGPRGGFEEKSPLIWLYLIFLFCLILFLLIKICFS